jgi:hypothetical protein
MPEQSYGSIAGSSSESMEQYYVLVPADTIVLIPLQEEEEAQHVPG